MRYKMIRQCALTSVAFLFSTSALAQVTEGASEQPAPVPPVPAQPAQAAPATDTSAGTASTEQDDAGVQEIVVTAQHRRESLQQVPTSITAISSESIRERRIVDVNSLDSVVPGFRTNARSIFLRGVGLADFNPASSSSVATYIDGVLMGSPLSSYVNYFDVEQIEVLRGPQGTLYGRNSNGGAINIRTVQPTFNYTTNGYLLVGENGTVNLNAGVGGPITNTLAFRVAGALNRDDGVVYNRTMKQKQSFIDNMSGRVSLLWEPTDNYDATLRGNIFQNRADQAKSVNRGLIGPNCNMSTYYTTACSNVLGYSDGDGDWLALDSNLPGINNVDYKDASLTQNFRFSDLTLTSITAYSNVSRDQIEDTDQSPQQMLEIHYKARERQFTQELRLASADASRLKWVIGAFYLHSKLNDGSSSDIFRVLRPLYTTPSNPNGFNPAAFVYHAEYPYQLTTDSYAAFAQADYSITDKLNLTAGLRYSVDRKNFDYAQTFEYGTVPGFTFADKKTFSDWSGRLALRYQVTDRVDVYGSASRGYKAGGFFGGSANSPSQLEPYDNETLNAYEIGVKSELFDRRLRFNAAGFLYDYKNQQVFTQVVRNGVTTLVLDNAANSTIYGAEFEVTARPIEDLTIQASLALLHARYDNYVTLSADYSHNRLPNAPSVGFSGSATYDIKLANGGAIRPNVDWTYRSMFYTNNQNLPRLKVDPTWIFGARIDYVLPNENIQIGAFVRNLTNKIYPISITNIDSLGYDIVNISRPRVIGLSLAFNY